MIKFGPDTITIWNKKIYAIQARAQKQKFADQRCQNLHNANFWCRSFWKVTWFRELNFEDFIHWWHTKNELKHSFNLFLPWFVLILLYVKLNRGRRSFKSSTQAVAWPVPVSRGHSCQIYSSFFTACIFYWDRASGLASSSASTLHIPGIQSLRFQSARFWVPFWNGLFHLISAPPPVEDWPFPLTPKELH